MKKALIGLILFLISSNVYAGDEEIVKQNVISKFSNSVANALENIVGGEGDTEVKITGGEDYHPEFSIMTVRPLSVHPEVDVWFVQLQLNETKIRGNGRYSINTGIGYRKLSDSKNSFTGSNVFIDWDEKGNTRASVGLELRASAFEAFANYYQAISNGKSVGTFTERVLDGYEVSLVGEVPYLPWANLIYNNYEWKADQNSKDSRGEKLSLELILTPNFIIEGGADDNNLDGGTNFVKAYLIFPARDRVAATTNLIGESAFSNYDMSSELLSKVRRTNKMVIESEGSGIVIGRASE